MSLANGDSSTYFSAAAERRLVFQVCGNCGATQFPPRHHCAKCWETDLSFTDSAGTGAIESFTIVRRSPLPEYRDQVPYVVAAIAMDEGIRMIARIVGDTAMATAIGDAVTVDFAPGTEGDLLPVFRRI